MAYIYLNQNQLAELFDTSKQNIDQHIANILKEGELHEYSVVKNYFTTATDDYYKITLPSFVEEPIVNEFREIVYQIPIIIDFDWSHWDEGREMAQDEHFDFDSSDLPTKCKLITAIVRNDRFCDGALANAF